MQSASCIKKTKGRCNQVEETVYLTDRYGKRLPVATHCSICENTIYNGTPLSLHGYLRQERKWVTDTFHLRFTLEDKKRVNQVLRLFFLEEDIPHYDFTKGHEVKSVE